MKAFLSEKYGPPDTLRLANVETRPPNAAEILVKIRAISVNPADWHCLRGKPVFSRVTLGLLKPNNTILGVDVAGDVEVVGRDVTEFTPGDAVFGNLLDHGFGGFAEYVSAPAAAFALKPRSVSFEEAAAVPMAGVTALQGLRQHGGVSAGKTVLVNGASGGVGHFAVQIAKAYGAVVTGVTSTRNVEFVRSLGADQVIDYTREDFTRTGRRWDHILDTIGNRSVTDLRHALSSNGRCAVAGFTTTRNLLAVAARGGKQITLLQAHSTAKDLDLLAELIDGNSMRPALERRYAFADLPDAIRYLETGRARGKVVVTHVA